MSAWKEAEIYNKWADKAEKEGQELVAKKYREMAEQAEREYRDECRREDAED